MRCVYVCVLITQSCVLVAQLCPTLCHPMDCSPPGSSVHGIFQARILEWVVISFSKGSSWPMDRTHVSCIGRQILHHWTTWEALCLAQFSSVAQSYLTLCDTMDYSTPGFPVHHQLLELAQTHVHRVGDADSFLPRKKLKSEEVESPIRDHPARSSSAGGCSPQFLPF